MNPNKQNVGGFDCDFVERPHKAIQSECPVCLLIIREPHQATCCGYSYCKNCIERIKATNNSCPCCKVLGFQYFEDKRLKRSLYELQVHCSNRKQGCQWVGELGQLDNHINANPSQTKLLEGCKYARVPCNYCHLEQSRSIVQGHQEFLCPKRPFKCVFCNQYSSNYEDVSSSHWLSCGHYPVPCTYRCGVRIPRKNHSELERHVSTECPKRQGNCSSNYIQIGCSVKLPQARKTYIRPPSPSPQWSMTGKPTCTPTKRNNGRIPHEQRAPTNTMNQSTMCTQNASYYYDQTRRIRPQINYTNIKMYVPLVAIIFSIVLLTGFCMYVQNRSSTVENHLDLLSRDDLELQNHASACPTTITLTNFTDHYDKDEAWISSPFYTHPRGYKMCLKVYTKGYGKANGTHVSVFVFMMQGDFDDELSWPFLGSVAIQLLNQTNIESYEPKMFHFAGRESAVRVKERDRAKAGMVYKKFISHAELSHFLKHDSLMFSLNYKP